MGHAGSEAQQALWARQNQAAADYAHVPRNIMWGVYGMETNFGRDIGTSSAGATGLMQFLASTAAQWNYPQTNYPTEAESQQQFTAGALYLRWWLHRTGDWNRALIGYSGSGYGLLEVTDEAGRLNQQPLIDAAGATHTYQQLAPTVSGITRVDDGIDMTWRTGLGAIANGRVLWRDDNQWKPWGAYMALSIDDGPRAGWRYYVAEGISPVRRIGEHVNAGDVIAQLAINGGNGIGGNGETGWAGFENPAHTLAQERGHGGQVPSPEGEDFRRFYTGIPAGDTAGPPVQVSPADLAAAFDRYDWSGDLLAAFRDCGNLTSVGYGYAQQARREILEITRFDTRGGR